MFDLNTGQDLEKLARKLSVAAQVPETFELLCPKTSENVFFELDPNGANSHSHCPVAVGVWYCIVPAYLTSGMQAYG